MIVKQLSKLNQNLNIEVHAVCVVKVIKKLFNY